MRYVDGDYNDPKTFDALRTALGDARRPVHYLAIPPKLFATVVGRLGESDCARDGRVVVEKPFGHDLASARELNRILRTVFPEEAIYRIDHFLGETGAPQRPLPAPGQQPPRHAVRSPARDQGPDHDGRGLRRGGTRLVLRRDRLSPRRRGEPRVPDRVLAGHGRARPSRARRPPAGAGALVPVDPSARPAPTSCVASTVAIARSTASAPTRTSRRTWRCKLFVDSPRWAGVPFVIRAGKRLPVTATEAVVEFADPPLDAFPQVLRAPGPTYLRFRLSPDVATAVALRVLAQGPTPSAQVEELLLTRRSPTRRRPTSGCSAARSRARRASSCVRTPSRRAGGSWPACLRSTHRLCPTSRARGDPPRPPPSSNRAGGSTRARHSGAHP